MNRSVESISAPVLLALDTADEVLGAAVCRGGKVLSALDLPLKKGRDAALTELARAVLSEAGLTLENVEEVAICSGPGSFTGLRVGYSFAKGICFARGLALKPVSAFEALAHSAAGSEGLLIPVIHARGEEVYAAVYRKRRGNLELEQQGDLYRISQLRDLVSEPCTMVGSGFRRHYAELKEMLGERLLNSPEAAARSCASEVGILAEKSGAKILSQDLAAAEPEYLQNFPRCK